MRFEDSAAMLTNIQIFLNLDCFAKKMEEVPSFEKSIHTHQPTRQNIPEDTCYVHIFKYNYVTNK